jgi:cytochrome c-type protein NapC
MFVMPIGLIQVGISKSINETKKMEFCTSCHEMQVYGLSLHVDDPEYLPAVHYQNGLVPRVTTCYTCHTDYTLYGDVSAKFNGLKHMWIHFFGDIPAPGEFKTYTPYPNDNCLQCHKGARRFEKKSSHTTKGVTLEMLYSNQKSCVSSGCHDKIHDIKNLGHKDIWGTPEFELPEVLKQVKPAADDPFAEEPAGGAPGTAKDPFDEPSTPEGGGAKDPFADEPTTPDAGAKPAGDKPASELKNVDDLFDEAPADAAKTPGSGDGDAGGDKGDTAVEPKNGAGDTK